MPERLTMSVSEAAEILGISRSLAYTLVRIDELPSLKLGRRVVVPRAALERFVETNGLVIDLREKERNVSSTDA
jgi:excisionase family DNA binding protein